MNRSESELIYDLITGQYVRILKSMKTLMKKAQEHAEKNKFDVTKFMDCKLAPDMFSFTKQIQIMTDNAKGAVARLSGKENPSFADNEKSWEELLGRLDKTIDFINKFEVKDFANFETQKATFPWYPGAYLEGRDYLISFGLPNFYFHATTAYGILRAAGVQVGKGDFIGELNWKK